MDISEIFPPKGHIQRLYCDKCEGYLDLIYKEFNEFISEVDINITDLPYLHCSKCNLDYFPDKSRFAVINLFERAIENRQKIVHCDRNKLNRKFDLTEIPFVYDCDDYEYIPGLKRPWDDGFLTPVFFNKTVLIKYDNSPDYRLSFASTTYGEIRQGQNFSVPFGINKNNRIIMWLGDVAKLSESEQYYLKSENIHSDHSIGSEFYDGQIECIFTELSKEDDLFKKRSDMLEAFYQRFEIKIAHLDEEVLNIATDFHGPIIDSDKEWKKVADILNKLYIESFDTKNLGKILTNLGGDSKSLGNLKILQNILKICANKNETYIEDLMTPLFVLYDLRIALLHLASSESKNNKILFVKQRLNLDDNANLFETYDELVKRLGQTFYKIIQLI